MPETIGVVGRGRRLVAVVLACGLCLGTFVVHVATTAQPAYANVVGPNPSFQSITFGDANHGWAVGALGPVSPGVGGLIGATTNGGVTWTQQSFPTSIVAQFDAIAAAGPTTAWAVGYSSTVSGSAGVVMTTTDGSHWSPQTIPAGVGELNGVSFVNTTTGWAVGAGTILATINGGITWTSQAVPSAVGLLTSVSFVDASHGWAAGGLSAIPPAQSAVIATSDGGAHWALETVPAGSHLDAITFRDRTHGWAGGSGTSAGAPPPGQVIATTDGGATWTAQTLPAANTEVQGVAFASLTVGWIVSYFLVVGPRAMSEAGPFVATTTDGGATWTPEAVPLSSTSLGAVTATSPTQAWVVGAGSCNQPSIAATSDGGAHWTEMLNAVPTLTSLSGVASVDSTHSWAVGTDSCASGAIVRTTDGATWTAAQVPAGVGGLAAVSFADRNHGWAVGSKLNSGTGLSGVVLGTTDGGATWSINQIPDGVGGLSAVNFISATKGWAVGTNSTLQQAVILTTSDGGQSWTSQTPPAGFFDMSGVWFVDASHGWATGGTPNAQIMVTSDGGASWAAQGIPPLASPPDGIDFVDSMHGWAASHNDLSGVGQVLNTADGGTTWTQQAVASSDYLDSVSFANTTSGGVAGFSFASGGVIAASTNAGASWTSQAVPAGVSQLNDLSAASTSHAWAVGFARGQGPYGMDAAVILGTSNAGTTWSAQPYTYPGMPRQGILPALSNAAYGGYTTAAYIQNLGAAPASVQVNYFDAGRNPVGTGHSNVIQPNGTCIVRQDNGRSFATGQAGTGVILGSQPLAAFVNEFAPAGGDATSYGGITSGVGSTLYAPAIANGAYGGYTTGIGLVNLAASPTNITVTYRDSSGTVVKTQPLNGVAAGAYQGVYSGAAGLPSGFAGTATITSSAGSLAAVVNETGHGNQFSSYDAVAAGSTTSYAPVALNNAFGGYNTGMGIQNTTGSAGTVTITYYDSTGTATVKTSPIVAHGYLAVYQGTDIPTPGAYTAKLTSSVPVAAIANEGAPSNTSAKQSTAYNTFITGSSSLHLPLVESTGADGWSTGEGIMNTGAVSTTVTVTYVDITTGAVVGTPQTQTLAPNAFWGLYQPTGGLPSGTRATAVITTSAGGQVAVICNESNATTFMSYDGQ